MTSAQTSAGNLPTDALNGHRLYTPEDLRGNPQHNGQQQRDRQPSNLYLMIIDGGLSICKNCGDGEAGLENPCRGAR